MPHFITVARRGDIPEGTGKAFSVNQRSVAVFHTDGAYYAIDDVCPHMGASLAEGHLENNVVTCPWHAWRFSVCDGTWCDNRRLSIDSFQVRLLDEEIQVYVPESNEEEAESNSG